MRNVGLVIIAFILLVLNPVSVMAATSPQMNVEPPAVDIDAFYNGRTINVSGVVPAGDEVVIRLLGQNAEMHFKQKGKVFGLLWMNLNSVSFSNIPNVFLLYSSKELSQLAGEDGTKSPANELGLTGLGQKVVIEPDSENADQLFEEFLHLKKKQHLYAEKTDGVTYQEGEDGRRRYEADIKLPSQLPPAEYHVEAIVLEKGRIVGQASQSVEVKMTGLPKLMASLAFNHGAFFGIMASIIAILGGLMISLLFKGAGKGAH